MRPDPLLEAIFQPGEEGLRAALGAARRRRTRRVLVPWVAGAACLIVALHLLSQAPSRSTALHSPPQTSSIEAVTSRPLMPRELVQTTRTSVSVVSTSNAGMAPRSIADSELLGAYHAGRAALVGPSGERRLVEF